MSMEQDIQGEAETKECMDPVPKLTQLKTFNGDLLDNGKTFHDVTKDSLEELMTKKTTMLSTLRVKL